MGLVGVAGLLCGRRGLKCQGAAAGLVASCVVGPKCAPRPGGSQGISAVENICGNPHVLNHLSIPAACFTHPEVSFVGVTQVRPRFCSPHANTTHAHACLVAQRRGHPCCRRLRVRRCVAEARALAAAEAPLRVAMLLRRRRQRRWPRSTASSWASARPPSRATARCGGRQPTAPPPTSSSASARSLCARARDARRRAEPARPPALAGAG
jgi:hypothetical protein